MTIDGARFCQTPVVSLNFNTDPGVVVATGGQIGQMVIEPSVKATWEYEYKYSELPITAGFAGIPGPSATFFGPNEGHDSAANSAGLNAQLTLPSRPMSTTTGC